MNFQDSILWTDSSITLYWIATPPYKLKTFVANRVSEIQQQTINFTWRHIPSQSNPADIVSRGLMPQEIKNKSMWWYGPNVLHAVDITIVENPTFNIKEFTTDLELKSTKSNVTTSLITNIHNSKNLSESSIFKRYSSFNKLIRVWAYCLRFVNKCKKNTAKNSELTVQELDNALKSLIKNIQQSTFPTEIKYLTSNKDLPNNSNLKSLNPFMDKNGLLRVGGRLKNINIDYDSKHQMLLPANHDFVNLLYEHEHRKHSHAGPQLLLSLIRRRFWSIHGKNKAKQTVRNCVICTRTNPSILKQIMGDLPEQRVAQTKPFLNTGVDFCGPILIRNRFHRKMVTYKVYVASFVCFSIKAIHLEVVGDLTAESFIACLKRFLSRRGKVDSIWSDNGTNFSGANKELKKLRSDFFSENEQNKITSFCASEYITWHFNPPRAPNFGGLWEASIKSFKAHLKRVTKNTVLTLEEFETLTVQIEGLLNARPLTSLSDNPNDPEPLTPNHFLTGGPNSKLYEPTLTHIPDNSLSKWQRVSKMVDSFWNRYSVEYLHTLQIRNKWKQEVRNIKINDIVILVDENIPSIRWLLGRIISIIPGRDNKVRVVEVRTKNGIFKRSISKICTLPIKNDLI